MDSRYHIATECIYLLQNSDLHPIKKLRLEIQLIQAKRMLLEREVVRRERMEEFDDAPFVLLLSKVTELCRHGSKDMPGANLSQYMSTILADLSAVPSGADVRTEIQSASTSP